MYKSDGYSVLDVLFSLNDLGEADTQLGYFRSIDEADQETVTRIAAMETRVQGLAKQIDGDRAVALEKEMGLREQQASIEDQLAARETLLADLDARVKKLLAQQARLDAAASARLARAAGVDLATIHGTPAQIAVVEETMKYLGIPYVWAGATPSGGFDCSGLVLYVYAKFGVAFPHGATMQAHMGRPVSPAQAPAGGPGVLRHAGLLPPRGHLHRQRPVHRGAAHRRRGQGEPSGGPRLLAHLPVLHQPALTATAGGTVAARREAVDCRHALVRPPDHRAREPGSRHRHARPARPHGWRLAKHGAAVSQRIAPLADGLARRSDEITTAAERLSVDAEQLSANIARMQRSATRLQVIAQSVNDAMRPYWLIAGWLSGEKEWSDLGI